MHRLVLTLAILLVVPIAGIPCAPDAIAGGNAMEPDLTQYVNPMIGTKPWQEAVQVSEVEFPEGNTYPGVGWPFAMTQWTAQTSCGPIPYCYYDTMIQGFRATHYPSGAVMSDYGSITVMPMTGEAEADPVLRGSAFEHDDEVSLPQYYSVNLDTYGIRAELTASSRCGVLRCTYPAADDALLMFDFFAGGGEFEVDYELQEVRAVSRFVREGTPNFGCYYVAKLSKPFSSGAVTTDDRDGPVPCAYIRFTTTEGEQVELRIGSSFISHEQARLNLDAEIGALSFDQTRQSTRDFWNRELSKIEITGGTEAQKINFYTAMYHALLLPREFSEHGRYYSPYDGEVHEGVSYTDYSLWDTFRALHPLLILIAPDRAEEMITSLLQNSDEGGWIPKWPNPGYTNVMMGTHADSMIADAYIKGLRGFDAEKAWAAMEKNANQPGGGKYAARVGIEDYKRLGFVPGDNHGECIARTLEFAYDDFCLAQMAKALSKDADYRRYIRRAQYYKNVLDPETKLVRGRWSDGSWKPAGDHTVSVWAGSTPETLDVYKWNHVFLAPQDISGLIKFFGWDQAYESNAEVLAAIDDYDEFGAWGHTFTYYVDQLFEKDYYYVGDEFSMHAPYLYNYAGAPWKTQRLTRRLLAQYFKPTADGLCGNEDCGQVSAWYIFGALGFYPVTPGTNIYSLTSPVFDRAVINLPRGGEFIVETVDNTPENVFIQEAWLNGELYTKSFITHGEIMAGGVLKFRMGPEPNEDWGSAAGDRPVSSIDDVEYVPVPWISTEGRVFTGSTSVDIGSMDPDSLVYFTVDGSTPGPGSHRGSVEGLIIDRDTVLKARAFREGCEPSEVLTCTFEQVPVNRTVILATEYAHKYSAGGAQGLCDGQRGGTHFMCGLWLGYEVDDFEAVLDLGEVEQVQRAGLGCLEDTRNWILFPTQVEIAVSVDGNEFETVAVIDHDQGNAPQKETSLKTFIAEVNAKVRYIKVKAKNTGHNPDWHPYSGGKAWLFVDEIVVE